MSDLCADPACAQIREWYLADEVKLAQIRALCDEPSLARVQLYTVSIARLRAILDGEPQP